MSEVDGTLYRGWICRGTRVLRSARIKGFFDLLSCSFLLFSFPFRLGTELACGDSPNVFDDVLFAPFLLLLLSPLFPPPPPFLHHRHQRVNIYKQKGLLPT